MKRNFKVEVEQAGTASWAVRRGLVEIRCGGQFQSPLDRGKECFTWLDVTLFNVPGSVGKRCQMCGSQWRNHRSCRDSLRWSL